MTIGNSEMVVLQTIVVALGAGLAVWGIIILLEGYKNDDPEAKSQGTNLLMAGGNVAMIRIANTVFDDHLSSKSGCLVS